MRRKYIRMLAFFMITVLMFDLGSLSISAETVSENQLEEAEISLSGYCGRESENDGKNVTYTISDSDNDGIYDLLEIKGNGRIRESGTPDTATADVKYGLDDLSNPLPWQIDINELELTKVVIGEGITDISSACYCLGKR